MIRTYPHWHCTGCGIPLSDGYTLHCPQCHDRRHNRLRRGETLTPTGYAGEVIDNTHPKGILRYA